MLPLMHDDIRKMRAIKDAEEIELMRHAQSITDAAFQHMLGFIKPGMTEKQVRNELENFMFANGARQPGLRLHRGERSQHRQPARRAE